MKARDNVYDKRRDNPLNMEVVRIFYTPRNEVRGGGGVYWNHPVRPSVRPSVCLSVRL